jgi:hypothetical protein
VYSAALEDCLESHVRVPGWRNERGVKREDRIARNEVLFREVNERVRDVHEGDRGGPIGFLCECGREECTETVMLTIAEYEDVRSDPRHFFVAPGHEIGEVERSIGRNDRYVVVEKHPTEATTALDTDPRAY